MTERDGFVENWASGLARILVSRVFDFTGSILAITVLVIMFGVGRARLREGGETPVDLKKSAASLLGQESHGGFINRIAFSPDGSHLAVSTLSGLVTVKSLATGSSQTLQRGPIGSVRQILFSPDRRILVSVGKDSVVRSWDWESGVVSDSMQLDTNTIRCVALSHDGGLMAAGGTAGHFVSWAPHDGSGGQSLARLGLCGPVNHVAFSPDGRVLAAVDTAGMLRLWELSSGRTLVSVRASEKAVLEVIFSQDGSRLLTVADQERVVRVWESTTGASLGSFPPAAAPITAIAGSSDGSMVAVARSDGVASLLDATTGRDLGTIRVGRHLGAVAFSPNGRILATGGVDGVARLWDLKQVLSAKLPESSRPDRPQATTVRPEEPGSQPAVATRNE